MLRLPASMATAYPVTSQRARSLPSRVASCLLYCLMAACSAAMAQPRPDAAMSDSVTCGTRLPGDARPRIGLALGGGGARGIAHISVLRMIEELHIPIDCVAGTSMGALVGGLYASGMSDRKSTRLNSSHVTTSRMPSSA